MLKTASGRFFEDFRLGEVIRHATPRTLTAGDMALYSASYGGRFAVQSADTFAQAIGYPRSPIDDFLVFHVVFGKTVPDISLNAVANLGYAGCRFLAPVYPGDTLTAISEVIGLKQNSNGQTGIVYVRSQGSISRPTLCSTISAGSWCGSAIRRRRSPRNKCRRSLRRCIPRRSVVPAPCSRPIATISLYRGHPTAGAITSRASGSTMSTG